MEGARLGPYQILTELGSGGMGTVYRAEVLEDVPGLETGCAVALKVIHGHLLSQPGFFQRFLREADIGRSVQHENVVKTHVADALLLDGVQQNFLVMEYVEGQTLRDLLEELERVPEELCRHIGREVAQGLAAIHAVGAVHRDLKPENVLITADHVVKVMDLGVARLQDEAIRLSRAGAFVGSLEYAAPEQFRSSQGEPDGRADLHALGVLLYELSTGQHPYRDEDVSKVLHRILEEMPRKAGEVNPQLSPFFEEVVQTLVVKDRDQRFPSASDLAGVLEEGESSEWWRDRARALRVETKRPLRRIRVPRETALYGRDDDLDQLRVLYEKAKAGDGQVLLVEGEAGIGKTRLVDEFVGLLRQQGEDINFLFGSYPPGGAATASGAFSEAYREQFGAEGLEDTLAEYLKPSPVLIPAFAAILRGETTPQGAEPVTKDSLQAVFVHATRGLAAERTTIVLIDDLHFAPEDGRALFSSLAMSVSGHRILMIGTMRPGVPEAWTAGITRLDHAEQRSLSRLGLKDFSALLKDAFRSERLAHELGMRIAEKSDGNPFFAFEIIRGLREGQFISQRPDGTWITTRVIQDIEVPSSVLDLVSARVAGLTEEERDLLDVASCCGFAFDPLLVADVLGLGQIPAMKRLAHIEKKHRLIRASGVDYVFDHHQVQEALYGGLHERLRQPYHAAIAESLEVRESAAEQDPKDLDGSLCVDLCDHFLKGMQEEKALRYLDAALMHLEAGYLNERAIALADRVLDVRGLLEGKERLEILLRKEARLGFLGRPAAQEDALAEARALAESVGDRLALARVENATCLLKMRAGRYEAATACADRAVGIAEEAGDAELAAASHSQLARVLQALGRHEEARTHVERALAISREIGDRRAEAGGTVTLGMILDKLDRREEAIEAYERALALSREAGNKLLESVTLANLAASLIGLRRFESARSHLHRAMHMTREIGNRQGECVILTSLANLSSGLGLHEEALGQYERQVELSRETGDPVGEAIGLINLGPVWMQLGQLERGRQALEASLALCRKIDARYPEGYALYGLSEVAWQGGDTTRALSLAVEALALRREISHGHGVSDSLIQLGALKHAAGEPDEAREALDEAIGLLPQQNRKSELANALATLATLPGGDAAAAEVALDEAGEAGNTIETRYHLWKATGKPEHLTEAKRLIDHRVEHSPEEYRESMLKDVRLNREVMEAWASRDP